HREGEGGAGRRARRGADAKVGGGGAADDDGVAGPGDGRVDRVGRRDRLATAGPQRGDEVPRPVGQRAVGRQGGGAVRAGEVHRPRVDERRVVELVPRGHRVAERRAGRRARRGADAEVGGGRGADEDRVAGTGDAAVGGVGGRDGLVARRLQRDDEGADAAA